MGSANDDRNRNTLYFGEMIVYFEFLFEIARLGCLVVSLYDDLVALFRSDGVLVASRISSFAEDCDDTVLVVIFEILENSFQCCIGRSVIENIGTSRMKVVVSQRFEAGWRTEIRGDLILVSVLRAKTRRAGSRPRARRRA